MGTSKRDRVKKRSLIKSGRKQKEEGLQTLSNQHSVKRFKGTGRGVSTGDDSVLILIKGDPFSRTVEKDARRARFSGRIIKLSLKEAISQGTPLPLLIKNHKSWAADGLVEYFRKNRP